MIKSKMSGQDDALKDLVNAIRPFMTGMMSRGLSKISDDTLMRLEILTPEGHAIKFKAELWKNVCRIVQQYNG